MVSEACELAFVAAQARQRACAKEAGIVRLARPDERAHHGVVAERLAYTLRAHVVQHFILRHLAAPQLNKDILWVAARALDELHADLRQRQPLSATTTGLGGRCGYAGTRVGVCGWVRRTESLNTRATCFMVWPSPPAVCVGTNGRMANVCRVCSDNAPLQG